MRHLNKAVAWYLDYRSTKEVISVFISQHSLQVERHRNFGFGLIAILPVGRLGCSSQCIEIS